jgi:hypothetical protein
MTRALKLHRVAGTLGISILSLTLSQIGASCSFSEGEVCETHAVGPRNVQNARTKFTQILAHSEVRCHPLSTRISHCAICPINYQQHSA